MTSADAIVVRPLLAADVAQYRRLRLASLRDHQYAHGPDYHEALEQDEAWHAKRLARLDYTWLGAFEGDSLVGAICLRAKDGARLRHTASLNSLMVASSHQRAGIGRKLVARLLAHARTLRHLRRLTLSVIDGNLPALRLYEAAGFTQFGFEPDAIFHEGGYRAHRHLHLSLVAPD
jgi:RimJ/RimL family protein N-acetyltransferase